MGSGKTTLFERVKSNCPEVKCIDLDHLLHEKLAEGEESLGDAIRRVGWDSFREAENKMLYQELNSDGDVLLSLGGGSLTPGVVDEIDKNPKMKLVWLETGFDTCWSRVSKDKNRPLVAKGKDFLNNLYNERKDLYSRASIQLNTEDQKKIRLFQQLIQN